jgi:peroxiredoxin
MRALRTTVLLAATTLVATAGAHGGSNGAAAIGRPAPGFTLKDQDGKAYSLADFKGKIVVLEWTNPDCPVVQGCYKEDRIASLAEKYAEKEVVWLAINSSHYAGAEMNKKWREKQAFTYPVLDDHSGDVARTYGAKTTPHMFIVDASGALVYSGALDNAPPRPGSAGDRISYVDQALGELLAGKQVSVAETKPYGCSVKYAAAEQAKGETKSS